MTLKQFFKNKNIILTGASGGLGLCLGKQLQSLGANIFSIINSKPKSQEVYNFSKEVYACDFLKKKALKKLLNKNLFSKVDILINCAGLWKLQLLEETPLEDYEKFMKINVRAPFALSMNCIKSMKKKGGIIVNIGSSSSYNGCGEAGAYSISKHALLGLSRSLSKALKKYEIRALIYLPGSIQTPMGEKDTRQDFNAFLKPQKLAEYIIYTMSLSNEMIIDEPKINRISIA